MKQLIFLLFLVTVALSITVAQPISNVVAVQKDSLVEITYNLEGENAAYISVYYCEKDGDELKGPLTSVTGDVGNNIDPGLKKIIWNVLNDQDFLVSNNITFRVKGIIKFGKLKDERDGKIYKTVKIGDQIWMAENLAYKSDKEYYYYDKNPSNGIKYGFLYKWKVAQRICPIGWHLPSKGDLDLLIQNSNVLGTNSSSFILVGGESDFSVLLGGMRNTVGDYKEIGNRTGFWTSTECEYYKMWYLQVNIETFSIDKIDEENGYYVRCIKD